MSDWAVRWIVGVFCLLVAAAGWFYMFYSRAAQKLALVEQPLVNRRRVFLRRVGGTCMIVLGAAFYICYEALLRRDVRTFVASFVIVLMMMAIVLILGLVDLRLTRELQRKDDRR